MRPYRYPYFKKMIERQVKEILDAGIIQYSQCLQFLVLLLKKKDGTWHSCVVYQALNAFKSQRLFSIPRDMNS